ncbi:hypothetical protein H6G96_33375 [Nostoc sp. FACHB-892]|nr:hypothetical protein [Nostoc sp. FACHB-892]MBD2731076.1 hypothetical protein [Nostoc sp. FACHB-892]
MRTDDEAIAPAGKLGDRPSVHREYTSDTFWILAAWHSTTEIPTIGDAHL